MTPDFDMGGLVLKAVASLVVVIGLAVLTIGALRRYVFRQGPGMSQHRLVSVVDSVGLGPRKGIVLLRVADQFLVVGYSESGLTYLGDVKDAAAVHAAVERQQTSALSSMPSAFSHILERVKL
jgi:flagellar protein FliO/FliZ